MLEKYTRVFEDAVRLMADCFDLELDEVRFEYELGACTKDVDLGWYQLPQGLARRLLPQVPRPRRRRAPHRDAPRVADDAAHRPDWDIQACYITKIDGDPCIYTKHLIFPKPGTDFSVRRGVRLGRDDRHRHAGAQLDPAVVDARRASSPAPTCRCGRSPAASSSTDGGSR